LAKLRLSRVFRVTCGLRRNPTKSSFEECDTRQSQDSKTRDARLSADANHDGPGEPAVGEVMGGYVLRRDIEPIAACGSYKTRDARMMVDANLAGFWAGPPVAEVMGGDVLGQDNAGSPGSGGASPYLRRGFPHDRWSTT
jgi:hypothetical protein